MSQVLLYATSVTGLLLALLAGVVWLHISQTAAGPRRWLTAVLVVYLAVSIHAVGRMVSWPLRHGFQPFSASQLPPGRSAIVLLGAGARTIHGRGTQRLTSLTLTGAARVLEAARVFRMMDSPWIISSGGATDGVDIVPDSEAMKTALIQLDVPADRIVLESSSRATHDEAVLAIKIVRDLGVTSVVLVTSEIHMRRALATFRHEGLQPVPAVAPDPLASQWFGLAWMPTTQGMELAQEIAHDYVGLAWYKLRGWI